MVDGPGLPKANLLKIRGLQPTPDGGVLAKGLLRDHLGLPASAVAAAFPNSEEAAPLGGLVRG